MCDRDHHNQQDATYHYTSGEFPRSPCLAHETIKYLELHATELICLFGPETAILVLPRGDGKSAARDDAPLNLNGKTIERSVASAE